ncbi:helix-turn-helix domain-containing protein [Pseudozobellia thermophila]|nr:AraC family transcriptional regulator [Pseudozobellia thermophila]
MKFRLDYIPKQVCQKVVSERLKEMRIAFSFNALGHLVVETEVSPALLTEINKALAPYGISLSETGKNDIVNDIKKAVEELVYSGDMRKFTTSVYLSKKLGYSYSYLSNLFSEETYTSIENFIILRKIEYAKRLIIAGDMSLTEIAFKLDYSSVAHLSGQFKKVTGLTPTAFLRILEKRNLKTKNL